MNRTDRERAWALIDRVEVGMQALGYERDTMSAKHVSCDEHYFTIAKDHWLLSQEEFDLIRQSTGEYRWRWAYND